MGQAEKTQTAPVSNRGISAGISDRAGRRLWPLQTAGICSAARRRTGLNDFGDQQIESRLSVLVKSLEDEANLHLPGRFLARMHLRDILET